MTVRTVLILGFANAMNQPRWRAAMAIDTFCIAQPKFAEVVSRPAPPGMLEAFMRDPAGVRAWLMSGHDDVVSGRSKHVKLYHTPDGPIVYFDKNSSG